MESPFKAKKKATEARCVTGKPLKRRPEKSLHQTLKVKPELYRSPQDV